MIDLINTHLDENEKLTLMIFHNVKIISYDIEEGDYYKDIIIRYKHTLNEEDCEKDEYDYETFGWNKDGTSLLNDYDRYCGICVDNYWLPIADHTLDEYLNIIRLHLNNEIVETELKEIEE